MRKEDNKALVPRFSGMGFGNSSCGLGDMDPESLAPKCLLGNSHTSPIPIPQ